MSTPETVVRRFDLARLPPALRDEVTGPDAWLYPDDLERYCDPSMHGADLESIFRRWLHGSALLNLRLENWFGRITAIQCQAVPSASFFSHVPLQVLLRKPERTPLVVAVHGSSRNAFDYRNDFAAFGQAHDACVMAPCFPMDMRLAAPDQQYTTLASDGPRADLTLLAMIDEFGALLGTRFDPVLLYGYSGGAQFAQRFALVHPQRLGAVSIGAPGYVTLPTHDKRWWTGVSDLAERFGQALDLPALRRLPVHLVIGADDTDDVDAWTLQELQMDAADYRRYGHNRVQRLQTLAEALRAVGVTVRHEVLPGLEHGSDLTPFARAAQRFFADVLRGRAGTAT
jgi:pimeloyl-ACP methyl ester carboxylesterase